MFTLGFSTYLETMPTAYNALSGLVIIDIYNICRQPTASEYGNAFPFECPLHPSRLNF